MVNFMNVILYGVFLNLVATINDSCKPDIVTCVTEVRIVIMSVTQFVKT